MSFSFSIEKKKKNSLARVGTIHTAHGDIQTPAFVAVGTKATIKALTPEQLEETGVQTLIANTYHLYLQPGPDIVKAAGGVGNMMGWSKPTLTDSGGFQVFSLGAAFGHKITKIAKGEEDINTTTPSVYDEDVATQHGQLAIIDEEGVTFTSHLNGSMHRFTPERSIEIQHDLGADIIFAFDECTSPLADHEYQKEAMDRTHAWARRSLKAHRQNPDASMKQALFGIVQGGRFEDLRKESAKTIGEMPFDGFGIGGSFTKEDMGTSVRWVNEILPEDKPRHMLGIGEPEDLFLGVENGCDLFDCVAPTRNARNGTLYTRDGKMHIENKEYRTDMGPIESDCGCYTCNTFTRSYLAHLFHGHELLANTLASIHNIYFIANLMKEIRVSLLDDTFEEHRDAFLTRYRNPSKAST
ncbi:tRNA guanosine(34) transglycosylase Tgt [Candidatus Wolfebacteria bacterium]|nr:MAG: tRNA guanosine(34) transglycosylase Tgt [Candidatus Wolfebacteria bacterium]